jgi:hypothetical protein
MAYKQKQEESVKSRKSYRLKYTDLEQVERFVKRGVYLGDFIVVAGIPYQMVEYSMESYGRGSRWVTYYNPYTNKQIYLDYAEKTVDFDDAVIDWKKDMSLDMKYLKKRFK